MMLTTRQIDVLRALVDRIIPPDQDAGGWEAGVGDYLARQFERDLKRLLPIYALGLDALDAEAQAAYTLSFERLPADVQDDLLRRIEQGIVTTAWAVEPAAWFRMAVEHCMEGYYSDPGNGGNRMATAWHMIGFRVEG